MATRALSFGAAATAYERYRPGYPQELADEIERYAGHDVRTALEIGAGTGKATRLFTGRGVAVTATEPDPGMLAELRRGLPDVRTVPAAFEELPPGGGYELVYAAAALHWTRPEGRWDRIAGHLAPGGIFASFGGPLRLADPDLADAVRAAREAWLPDDEIPSPDGTPADGPMQWPGTELQATDLFADVRQVRIERRLRLTADDTIGQLGTVSAYLTLDPVDRSLVMDRIRRVLPATVDIDAGVTLHLARRAR